MDRSPSSASPGPARAKFFQAIGRPELTERFAQTLYWASEKAELFPVLDEVFSTRSTSVWCAVLAGAGVRIAPVRDHAEVATDRGVWANGYLADVEGPTPTVSVVAVPVRFSETPARPGGAIPELGQHTEEVLVEIGYSWDDIGRLRQTGAI